MRSTPGKLSPCGTPRPASRGEVRGGSVASSLLRNQRREDDGRRLSPPTGRPARSDGAAAIWDDDGRIAPAARVAFDGSMHARGDGIDERVLEAGLQPTGEQL